MTKKLVIVDTSNFIFRAFYAIRPLSSPNGTPVNAVYGVMNMLMKLMSVYNATHIVLAKDSGRVSFRTKIYNDYKANRDDTPEDLIPQFPLIDRLATELGLVQIKKENYEADDVIGSLVTQFRDSFDEILIATSDKDLMQFVDERIKVIDTMKEKLFGPREVFEKMGVTPSQIVDYLSLVGDASDNVPGMKGVGAKGAADLLEKYGTLDNCIKDMSSFTTKKLKTAFGNYLEDALLSKQLITIVTDLDLGVRPDDLEYRFSSSKKLISFLDELGMKSVIKKISELDYIDSQVDETNSDDLDMPPLEILSGSVAKYPIVLRPTVRPLDKDILAKCLKETSLAISPKYSEEKLVYLSVACSDSECFIADKNCESDLNDYLRTILASKVEAIISECKPTISFALKSGIDINVSFFDTTQAHFVIDPSGRHNFESYSEWSGFEGEEVAFLFKFAYFLKEDIKECGVENVYYNIDLPLFKILARMENSGIMINPPYFKDLSKKYTQELDDIKIKILDLVKIDEINLRSPKQVAELLFEKLGLPVIKKNKTGPSCDSSVLEELVLLDMSEIPALILEFREIEKLLSTYIDVIPTLADKKGRVHTNFNQHIAATGRLSSDNPNLQNIPVRSTRGRLIRKGFIANPGNILMSADYSQIELRILANLSKDSVMIEAYKNGEDIHTRTASEIFEVPLDKVTSEQRSSAKAVNFGLMYGQSSFGLGMSLKIGRNEAKDYIVKYFSRFGRVKAYLDELKERVEELGYTETYFGRKRPLPDIRSTNRTIKGHAERAAINAPIQGTAADMLKISMLDIDKKLFERQMKAKLLLQVHDELIFELPENEADSLKQLVVDSMMNVLKMDVPFEVGISFGVNWYDLK